MLKVSSGPDHPWFIGVQFRPELKLRPFEPHPQFKGFIAAAVEQCRFRGVAAASDAPSLTRIALSFYGREEREELALQTRMNVRF